MNPILVFDFDGTVCLGEAPVEAYQREVCARVPDTVADDVRAAYADYCAGRSAAADGYFAIADALGGRLAPAQLSLAYQASRAWLAAHPDTVRAPEGLAAFLAQAGDLGAERVVLSNSPRHGVVEVLEAHGLLTHLDQVIGDADKPAAWPQWLDRLLADRDPDRLLSVGDVYANDCAGPRAAGAATAYIDAHRLAAGPATFTGASLPELYTPILDWITALTRAEGA